MYFPVEECNAVNFPLPGSDCVGWEDRNIQGLRISFYTVTYKKRLIYQGFPLPFVLKRNKENKLAQNSSALVYLLKKSYNKNEYSYFLRGDKQKIGNFNPIPFTE